MESTLLEMATDLTRTLVATGRLSPEDMQDVLQKTHTTLTALKGQEETGSATAVPAADSSSVNWRKSISKHAVTCLECGQAFKQLTIHHLGMHGLDGRSYRMKYAIPNTQPLTARALTERRRQVVQEIRPWEKTPTYRKGQARDGHSSRDSDDADAVHGQIEELTVEATTQPKRQRKTTQKKTVSKKRLER